MRLAQLHEAQEAIDSTDELIESIKKDCKDTIALYKRTNKVFLRGEQMSSPAFVSDIRNNRKPLQMKRSQHDAINDAFKVLGLEVTRGNAIFCTTSDLISMSWGQTYIIFPKDGWKGLVFENVKEGYVFHKLNDDIIPKAKIKVPVYPGASRTVLDYDKEFIASALQDLKPFQFSAKNADKVLREGYQDVLIKGSGYYAIKNPQGTGQRHETELLRVLEALNINVHNLGKQWEIENGMHMTLDTWKEKVSKKYPEAEFFRGEHDWTARMPNGLFVGVAEFHPGHKGYTQVFSHPRDTDY